MFLLFFSEFFYDNNVTGSIKCPFQPPYTSFSSWPLYAYIFGKLKKVRLFFKYTNTSSILFAIIKL